MDYAAFVSSAVAVKGQFQENGILNLTRSVRDVDNDCNRSYFVPYHVQASTLAPLCPPVEVLKYDLAASSGSGRRAVRMSFADEKCTVEVVVDGSLTLRFDASEAHGRPVGDNWFGGYCFSSDESRLVYVAAPKKPKTTTFFDKPDEKKDANAATKPPSANKYDYREDWGEKYTGVSELGLFVLELATGAITRVAGAGGEQETVGQPSFTPDGAGVVYTSWSACPKRLGMIYCYQRPCCVKVAYLASETVHILTPHLRLARYPVFTPSGARLVFLGSEVGFDMHNNCVKLFTFDFGEFQKDIAAASSASKMESYCKIVIDHVPGGGLDLPKPGPGDVTVNGYPFPGLFAGGLQARSFLSDELMLVEAQWRSYAVILIVDLSSGDIRVLTYDDVASSLKISQPFSTLSRRDDPFKEHPPGDAVISHSWLSRCPFSMSLIDCSLNPSRVVVAVSNPTCPPRMALFTHEEYSRAAAEATGPELAQVPTCMSDFFGNMTVAKTNVGTPTANQTDNHAALRSFVLHTRLSHASYTTTIESILMLPPASDLPPPLLVVPHGGPHSAFATAHIAQYNYLCTAGGFAILMVNYRGSTGFGKELLESLVGRIGTQDVFDVFAASESMLDVSAGKSSVPEGWSCDGAALAEPLPVPIIDNIKLGMMGGSHGGFLTAHCIGQRPFFFKAAVLRNPVTNVLANSMTSDIGDWCVVEGCGQGSYDFSKFVSPSMQALTGMYDCSPIRYVDRVSTPVLLCLGAKDRRVPHHQGLEYYHALKAHCVLDNDLIQMKVYPEADHAIDKPNSEADQFISMKLWFERFLV